MVVKKECIVCGKKDFRIVNDEWMKRTFRFVEEGTLNMCTGCGAKYLICPKCGSLITRIHPTLETWEVEAKCPNEDCDYEDAGIKAWDGVSAR